MENLGFEAVLSWLYAEREQYQTEKFDYSTEKDKSVEWWIQQFDSYIQRLPIFGLDNPLGVQAALKLAATSVGFCEVLAEKGKLPKPGVSSGTILDWE